MSDPLHIRTQSSSIHSLSATKNLLRHLFYFWTTSFSAKPTFPLFLPFFGMKTKSGKFSVHGFVLLGSERIREATFWNFTKFLTFHSTLHSTLQSFFLSRWPVHKLRIKLRTSNFQSPRTSIFGSNYGSHIRMIEYSKSILHSNI